MQLQIRLTYLYPYHMNLYGDTGNILCLRHRCQARNIDLQIQAIHPADNHIAGATDLYFFGGGQDAQQLHVGKDLLRHQQTIREDIENGVAALTICGGYQLFGEYFLTSENQRIPGIQVFSARTRGSTHRMIGNIICHIPKNLHQQIQQAYPNAPNTLVGFENHSGETILSSNQSPLAEVKYGYGNNYTSKQEGLVFHNAIGTYMHGSLLPKNPHLADYIIAKALQHRYQDQIALLALDDSLAWQAHTYVLNRFGNS